jgi:hypothetical protein
MMNGRKLNMAKIKSSLFLIVLILLVPTVISAQNPGDTLWTRIYGGSLWEMGYAVTPTNDGGFLAVGLTASYGAGSADFWLVRTDAWGDTLWTKVYGWGREEIAWDVQRTFDGGYIITGHTSSTPEETSSIWLMKITSGGDTLWTRIYGGPNWEKSFCVRQTADSGYVIIGRTSSFGAGNYDMWLLRTDSFGDTLWARTYGGTAREDGYGVQQTSDGGFIFTGSTYSYGPGGSDVWLLKTDANGDTSWAKTFGGSGSDCGRSVQQTSDGGYIIGGYTFSFGAGSADNYLIKTDSNGNMEWTRTYGGSLAEMDQKAWQTFDGGYIMGGRTESYGAGDKDFYVVKTHANGDTAWTRTYGGYNYDYCFSIKQTSDGGYIAFGYSASFSSPSDFYLVRIAGDSLIEIRGACCDDVSGICNDNVLQDSCSGRFAVDTLCADLDPPCGTGGGDCLEDEIVVKIMTDNFPEETTWEITDENFVVVSSGGPYPGQPGILIVDTVCVDSLGCYNFVIYDSGGNGIIPGGYFQIWLNSELMGANYSFDGDSAYVSYVGSRCAGLGACCDDSLDECNMYVDQVDCQGGNNRFEERGYCDDFDPPCGGCSEDLVEVHIMTDDYPDETTWVLRDSSGATVGSGGPYIDMYTLYIDTVCVDSTECYAFTIYDDYGDGIMVPGYYELYLNSILIESNYSFVGDSAVFEYVGNGCPTITGACCDDILVECNENVEQDSCQGPDMRFIIDGTCADFIPPCGGCTEDSIVVEIMTDEYPWETTWEILESGTSNVVGSGGPYNAYNTRFVEYICVEHSGCYDFVIYDEAGDGLCCDYGNGYYNVFLNDSLVASGGEFDSLEVTSEIGYGCGGSGCDYVVGDVNNSGGFNGLDVTYGVAYFKGGSVPPYECECTPGNTWYVAGDVNGSCNYNGLDITYAVAYFKGGPDPAPCPDCPPPELMLIKIAEDHLKNKISNRSSKSIERKSTK